MSQSRVFLCPSCQSVIQSDQGAEKGLKCPECGHEFFKRTAMPPPVRSSMATKKSDSVVRNVMRKRNLISPEEAMTELPAHEQPLVLRTEAPTQLKIEEEPDEMSGEMPIDKDEIIMSDGSRRVRRRKKKLKKEKQKGLFIFLFVWITIIGAVFYLYRTGDEPEKPEGPGRGDGPPITEIRNRMFVDEHFKSIHDSFQGFINQFEPGKRMQYIDQSGRLSLQFNRFYRTSAFPTPEGKMVPVKRNVIEISTEPKPILGLETVWEDAEGRTLETVHVHDGEGWKLDWEAFAPYSTSPWMLFNAQADRSEGTFRLYMRKMKSLDDSKSIFVKFYPPPSFEKQGNRGPVRGESPEVEILTRSDLGQKFIDIWEKYQNGDYMLGSMFPSRDPEGYLRVTVELAWEKDEKDRPIMVLKEILGPSWYGQRIVDAQNEETPEEEENLNGGNNNPDQDSDSAKKGDTGKKGESQQDE